MLIKHTTKINVVLNFVLCQVRLILLNTNLITKNYFISESCSKDTLNHHKFCEIMIQTQKIILASHTRIFSQWNSYYNSFEICFNFNSITVCTSHCKRKKTMVF